MQRLVKLTRTWQHFGATQLSLALVFALSLSGCHLKEDIRVGTHVWPGYETLHLAREMGFLPENVEMIELLSASDTMEAFRNGRIEVAALTLDEAITLSSEGFDITIFLVMDISNGADTLIAQNGISSLGELKGKVVGVEQTALGAFMLHQALSHAGLAITEIETLPLHINEHFNAFVDGQMDAVITFEPVSTLLTNLGHKVLFDSSDIPNNIVDVLVTQPDLLESDLDVLKGLVNAQFEALLFLESSPQTAAEIMSRRMGVTPDELLSALQGLVIPDRAHNIRLLAEVTGQSPIGKTLQMLSQIMIDHSIIPEQNPTKIIVTSGLIE